MARRLQEMADIIRSKNAGPYRITLDILFGDRETYRDVVATGAISPDSVARAYGLTASSVSSFFEIDMANAIKITLFRPHPQGNAAETDMYGCQQHVPLMMMEIPDTPTTLKGG